MELRVLEDKLASCSEGDHVFISIVVLAFLCLGGVPEPLQLWLHSAPLESFLHNLAQLVDDDGILDRIPEVENICDYVIILSH